MVIRKKQVTALFLCTMPMWLGLGASVAAAKTTLRNATRVYVQFTFKPHRSEEAAVEKLLRPGAVAGFDDNRALDITFRRGGKRLTMKIEPGEAYAFRFDPEGSLQLYRGSHGREDAVDLAPYVQTPMAVVEKMLELTDVGPDDVVYDIGCGDGRIVITAARRYGARGVGIDIVPARIAEAKAAAREAGVEHLVEFRLEDATGSDLSGATVVTMYLIPDSNALLRPMLERQLKPEARVISHAYPIPGWEDQLISIFPVRIGLDETHYLYYYRR